MNVLIKAAKKVDFREEKRKRRKLVKYYIIFHIKKRYLWAIFRMLKYPQYEI